VRLPLPRLHAITDERVARRADLGDVAKALAAGAGAELAFHARGRGLTGLEHFDMAVRLSDCPPARLFVNDRLDVALATGAAGVQLGGESMAVADARRLNQEWWIGRSVHDLPQAEAALAEGAEYLLLGPLFPTATHPTRTPLGTAALTAAARLGVPVVAIGGITPERVREVRDAGAWGVAAIRALWDAARPEEAARRMLEEMPL
jgi:thiamine-phosphate diphosphorylase